MRIRRGSAEKPVKMQDIVEVVYDEHRWLLLSNLRAEARGILEALARHGVDGYIHGSIARGDVDEYSDIDVVIPTIVGSHRVEFALTSGGYRIEAKKIVQATPRRAIKAHIYLDLEGRICVTFPLVKFTSLEWDFYRFGGIIDLNGVTEGRRVPGVSKRLTLIEPTSFGHIEYSIIGLEAEVARKLGVGEDIIRERIDILTRRDRVGRTGVYLSEDVPIDESFEQALREIAAKDPAIRRKVRLSRFDR
ncbi:MAG: nucleotidyltransferase domain-containing protein [Nitrososphaerota archaeon]|nr:nucleotidyltransferase domain-containing protein [Candidatus Bathyarchaeota archaeon]MDW8062299.1 nucleotidyltransferase domain-containing protein [Nitrososphaerota archaeon]